MAKQFLYRGKTTEQLKEMSLVELSKILPSKERRKLKRGLTEPEKKFLLKVKKSDKKPAKTHCRDLLVLPEMIGKLIQVYNGKTFVPISITEEMIGHRLGEFVVTRQKVKHSAPGIGATKSSASASVK